MNKNDNLAPQVLFNFREHIMIGLMANPRQVQISKKKTSNGLTKRQTYGSVYPRKCT